MNLKNRLLLKYKYEITDKCEQCKEQHEFNTNCKNNCRQKVSKAIEYINAGIPTKYINLPLEIFNNYTEKSLTINTANKRKEIYKTIKEYLTNNLELNINTGKGFVLFGNFGTGKSTLSMNIAKACVDNGKNVKVREFSEMVKISQTGYDLEDNEELDILQEFLNSDVYCIENLDWVYQKNNSDYVSMFLDNLVSLATKYNIVLVITSNMNDKDIKKNFNEHIYSVLHEICEFLDVPGEDIRLKKNK